MTEKTAALKVYIMWAWLNENEDTDKTDYPLYDDLNFDNMDQGCPWCELFLDEGCLVCPLERNSCLDDGSFYQLWSNSIHPALNAGEIAKIAWAEYKRLGG